MRYLQISEYLGWFIIQNRLCYWLWRRLPQGSSQLFFSNIVLHLSLFPFSSGIPIIRDYYSPCHPSGILHDLPLFYFLFSTSLFLMPCILSSSHWYDSILCIQNSVAVTWLYSLAPSVPLCGLFHTLNQLFFELIDFLVQWLLISLLPLYGVLIWVSNNFTELKNFPIYTSPAELFCFPIVLRVLWVLIDEV